MIEVKTKFDTVCEYFGEISISKTDHGGIVVIADWSRMEKQGKKIATGPINHFYSPDVIQSIVGKDDERPVSL